MALQYTPEQLQLLRTSPLVQKPASLPPAEEWMGPPAEQTQKRTNNSRGKIEGVFGQHDSVRTPLESRHLAKASGSGEIVLGPPKTSFASASTAYRGTPSESPGRSAFGAFGADTRSDYFSKSRPSTERGKSDFQDDKFKEPRGGLGRNGREEGISWSGRSERGAGIDDELTVGPSMQDLGLDNNVHARKTQGRFEPHRREITRELDVSKKTDESARNRGWRSGERIERPIRGGMDRDWSRDARSEQEPEWMGDMKSEQKREKHSAQDIEQWKASMKARDTSVLQPEPVTAPHARTSSRPLQNKTKTGVPLSVDPALDDKFLSFFSDASGVGSAEQRGVEEGSKAATGRANPKASKFTGFFSPQAPTPAAEAEVRRKASIPSAQASVEPVNEDKEGFQRILQMLGAPQPPASQPTDATPARAPTPPRNSQPSLFSTHSPPPILSPRSRKSHGLESLLGMQSPKEGAVPMNKDSEFLLNLLRPKDRLEDQVTEYGQVRLGEKPSMVPQIDGFSSEGFRGPHNHYDSEPHHPRYFNEQDLLHGRYQEKPTITAHNVQQHHHNRNLQFDDSDDGSVFPPQFSGISSQQSQPPGLQRPPGFDHPAPPPGFQAHFMPAMQAQPQHQRGPGVVGPPPGFAGLPNRNLNTQQFPPGLVPNMGNLSIDGDRGQPFNGRHMGPGVGAGHGPGGPPPGFAGLPGPPPGSMFSSMMGMPADSMYGPGRPFSEIGEHGHFRGGGRGETPIGQFRRQE